MLIICGLFTALGVRMVPNAGAEAWFVLMVFGLGAIIGGVMLLPGAGMLRLDRDGFETTSLFRRHGFLWQAVKGFEAIRISHSMTKMVVYDDINLSGRTLAKFNAAIAGRNAGLPDTYGLSAADLADVMTRWRERALTQQ